MAPNCVRKPNRFAGEVAAVIALGLLVWVNTRKVSTTTAPVRAGEAAVIDYWTRGWPSPAHEPYVNSRGPDQEIIWIQRGIIIDAVAAILIATIAYLVFSRLLARREEAPHEHHIDDDFDIL